MMPKKYAILLALVLIVAIGVPAAYASLNDTQQSQVNQLYKQMLDIRKQIVDKYVDAGQITPDQGNAIKKQIDRMYDYSVKNGGGFGPGMMGGAGGMMGGAGAMMGSGGCGGYGSPGGDVPDGSATPQKAVTRGFYSEL